MKREEAIVKFQNNEADIILRKMRKACYDRIVEGREEFKLCLAKALKDIVTAGEQQTEQFAIGCIHFAYLRAHFADGTYKWLVEAQGKDGAYDRQSYSTMFDMKWLFEAMEEYREALYKEAQKYLNVLTPADCDSLYIEELAKQIPYLYMLGIWAFHDRDIAGQLDKLDRTESFRVTLGERRGKSFILYKDSAGKAVDKDVLADLMRDPVEEDFNKSDYVLYDFSKYSIADGRIGFRNFQFSSFRDVEINNAELVFCKAMLSDWQNCRIQDCAINMCTLQGADFSNSRLENVSFAGCRLDIPAYNEDGDNIMFVPVSFRNASLKNVEFVGAYLAGCDFRGAVLDNIDWTDADMQHTIIDMIWKNKLELTREQSEAVIWIAD